MRKTGKRFPCSWLPKFDSEKTEKLPFWIHHYEIYLLICYRDSHVVNWYAVQLGAKEDIHPANVSHATDAMRWRMKATEMFCLHIKFVICTNQNQPLKFARQNSYLDLWSYTLYIIWEGVLLLVKLQATGTNKQTTKMKYLTSISQGFDKCTKTTLQNNHFWGTHPETVSVFKYDHGIVILKSAESLKLFWYEQKSFSCFFFST